MTSWSGRCVRSRRLPLLARPPSAFGSASRRSRRYEPAGSHALDLAGDLADRLDRAVDLLRDDGLAREAFRFANQAMALQRVRSETARARLADPESVAGGRCSSATTFRRLRSWRPFQLAFVLLCLPGLTDPEHAGRPPRTR